MNSQVQLKLPLVRMIKSATAVRFDKLGEIPSDIPFLQEVRYLNGSKYHVVVQHRSGQTIHVPPLQHNKRYNTDFVVQVRQTWRSNVNIDVERLFDEETADERSPSVAALRKSHMEMSSPCSAWLGSNYAAQRLRVGVVDYAIPIKDIIADGGSVYFHELDLTISLYNEQNDIGRMPHPHSPAGKRITALMCDPVIRDSKGFVYRLEAVDNLDEYGVRYINVNNQIYRIDPVKDPLRENGVHLYETAPVVVDGMTQQGIRKEIYAFAAADKELGLYRTVDDALALGNITSVREREFADERHRAKMRELEMQQATLILKQEMEQRAAQHAMDMQKAQAAREELESQLKRTREEMKLEQEKTKYEREQRYERDREERDRRSNDRKEYQEILKWIPAVIVAVGAIVAFIAGKKKTA